MMENTLPLALRDIADLPGPAPWPLVGNLPQIRPLRAAFCGPQTRPMLTYNPGPVRLFMVLFYPQAMHALGGIDIAGWVDRCLLYTSPSPRDS